MREDYGYPGEEPLDRPQRDMVDSRELREDRKLMRRRRQEKMNRRQRRRLTKINGGFKTRNRGVWSHANAHAKRMRRNQQK